MNGPKAEMRPEEQIEKAVSCRETFIKRYTDERTNKAEIRPEEHSEKTESCQENLWNEKQFKGP